jgi:hypothetical protein
VQLIARPAMLARVISPKRLPGLPAKTAGAPPKLVAGNANAASLISGTVAAQPCGTDKPPANGAGPRPAITEGTSAGPTAIASRGVVLGAATSGAGALRDSRCWVGLARERIWLFS